MAIRACRETADVHERGGVGVSELVSGDVSESGCGGGTIDFPAGPALAQPSAVAGEQEVRGTAGAWVWDGSSGGTGRGDSVDPGDDVGVDGDHAFGVKFAQGHFEPGAGAGDVDYGVELEVE